MTPKVMTHTANDMIISWEEHRRNGNVWKAIVECRTRNDIDVYTCYADNGIGVIFNRKNSDRLNLNLGE